MGKFLRSVVREFIPNSGFFFVKCILKIGTGTGQIATFASVSIIIMRSRMRGDDQLFSLGVNNRTRRPSFFVRNPSALLCARSLCAPSLPEGSALSAPVCRWVLYNPTVYLKLKSEPFTLPRLLLVTNPERCPRNQTPTFNPVLARSSDNTNAFEFYVLFV